MRLAVGLSKRVAIVCIALTSSPAVPAAAQDHPLSTLTDALTAAYTSNAELAAQRAALRLADEQFLLEFRGCAPSLSDGNDIAGFERLIGSTPDLGAANEAKKASTLLARRANLRAITQQVLFEAGTAFLDLWHDQSVLQLTKSHEATVTKQLEAAIDLFQAGQLKRTVIGDAESKAANSTLRRINAEGSLIRSYEAAKTITGVRNLGVVTFPEEFVPALPDTEDMAVNVALSANPMLAASRLTRIASHFRVVVDRAELRIARSKRVAGLDLDPKVECQNDSDRWFEDIPTSLRIGEVEKLHSKLCQSRQIHDKSKMDELELERKVVASAAGTWNALATTLAAVQSYDKLVRSSEVHLESVRVENIAGRRNVIGILESEQVLQNARVGLANAKRNNLATTLQLLALLGWLTPEKLKLDVEQYDPDRYYQAAWSRWQPYARQRCF